jgi:hypothetical protein
MICFDQFNNIFKAIQISKCKPSGGKKTSFILGSCWKIFSIQAQFIFLQTSTQWMMKFDKVDNLPHKEQEFMPLFSIYD